MSRVLTVLVRDLSIYFCAEGDDTLVTVFLGAFMYEGKPANETAGFRELKKSDGAGGLAHFKDNP
jgi:hypothetical protein